MSQIILGLGGLLSDPSCCLLKNGSIASAVEQAKVSRQDRSGAFPDEALRLTLEIAGIKPEQIDCIAIAHPFASHSESLAQLELQARFPQSEIVVVDHHSSHAASAYYCSPFSSAAVLSLDRAGDYRSAVLYQAEGSQLTSLREMYFPDSLGDLYNRVTELLGFEPQADEHKVQWLSASGTSRYNTVFQKILHRGESHWPHFDRVYFDADRLTQGGFSSRFFEECGLDPAVAFSEDVKRDLAYSLQTAVEATVISMLDSAENICLAGGLSLNSFLVRALEQRFKNVFVQPVGGNAGTSLGAALHVWHNFYKNTTRVPFETLCLGPEFSIGETKQVLENCKLRFQFLPTKEDLIGAAVRALNDQKIVAWMQGRMEFGPRALGNRSILASPLNPYSTENLNVYIKHRENFRKFAASVPEELADKYFEVKTNADYLATVSRVRPEYRDTFAAAVLGTDLVRVHTVRKQENPFYHSLLLAVGDSTGLPALYNTSFNLFGDPLVCTPRDAVRSFYSSGIDALFAGHFYLEK